MDRKLRHESNHNKKHYHVVWAFSFMVLATVDATPQRKTNNPNHARCLDKKYKKCYKMVHACPNICPNNCTVNCQSCKPVCINGSSTTAPPPQSDGGYIPTPSPTLPPESSAPTPTPPTVSTPDSVPLPPAEVGAPPPPPPPAGGLPPDDYPSKGWRWCRDTDYPDCYGNSMQCDSRYCPLDMCVMDCVSCVLMCLAPPPPSPAPAPAPLML